eukprot:6202812-Pleurochrysis_carterae.AAC.3
MHAHARAHAHAQTHGSRHVDRGVGEPVDAHADCRESGIVECATEHEGLCTNGHEHGMQIGHGADGGDTVALRRPVRWRSGACPRQKAGS